MVPTITRRHAVGVCGRPVLEFHRIQWIYQPNLWFQDGSGRCASDGSEVPQYQVRYRSGESRSGKRCWPVCWRRLGQHRSRKSDGFLSSPPLASESDLLREAILGVFVNAQSILNAAKFTVTNPAPPGQTLWSSAELISLAGQAQPWILAAANGTVPLGPPFSCSGARGIILSATARVELTALGNLVLTQGGEYMALRTTESFNILVSNLRTWATANAPSVDPVWRRRHWVRRPVLNESMVRGNHPSSWYGRLFERTRRSQPADGQTIENWLVNWLVPPLPPGGDYFSQRPWLLCRFDPDGGCNPPLRQCNLRLRSPAILWRAESDARGRQLPFSGGAQRLLGHV